MKKGKNTSIIMCYEGQYKCTRFGSSLFYAWDLQSQQASVF